MKKTGRERKAKRKAKVVATANVKAIAGDHWLADNERHEIVNNAMIRNSLRWNTESTQDLREKLFAIEQKKLDCVDPEEAKQLYREELEITKKLRAKDIAIAVTTRNMLSPNPTVSNLAVSNLIRMEKQNQDDDHKEQDESKPNQVTNNIIITCPPEERRNKIAAIVKRIGVGDVLEATTVIPAKRDR